MIFSLVLYAKDGRYDETYLNYIPGQARDRQEDCSSDDGPGVRPVKKSAPHRSASPKGSLPPDSRLRRSGLAGPQPE